MAALVVTVVIGAPTVHAHITDDDHKWAFRGYTYKIECCPEAKKVDPVTIMFKGGNLDYTGASLRPHLDEWGGNALEKRFCNWEHQRMLFFGPGNTGALPEEDINVSTSPTCEDQYHARLWRDRHHSDMWGNSHPHRKWIVGSIHREERPALIPGHEVIESFERTARRAVDRFSRYHCTIAKWKLHKGSFGKRGGTTYSDGYITKINIGKSAAAGDC